MQNDYMYMNDVIYTLTDDVRLVFHTVASFNMNNKTYSNYNEYKINGKQESNTMVKRTLNYHLFIEDRRNKLEKLCIFPEHMYELLRKLDYIKNNWIDNDTRGIYAFMDNSLAVINQEEYVLMRLPLDKAIKIAPGVMKTEISDDKCIDLYLNSNIPVQVSTGVFVGMIYTLNNFDMLNYANTSLSFMMLMNNPLNRIDFSYSNKTNNIVAKDDSKADGSNGRTFNKRNTSSFFD